jgi:outer membrane protein TolC
MAARRENIVLRRFQRVACWRGAATAFTIGLAWIALLTSAAQSYSFRGLSAPQVQSNPLTGDLQKRLIQLNEELRNRSVLVNLNQAIEQSLLHNPDLSLSYSQIQEAQWTLVAVRRQWYPNLSIFSGGDGTWLWRLF